MTRHALSEAAFVVLLIVCAGFMLVLKSVAWMLGDR
jgi:hypothetical protein